jgi:hypothetical protein
MVEGVEANVRKFSFFFVIGFLYYWLTATNTVFINFYLTGQAIELAIRHAPLNMQRKLNKQQL